ncbi:hypothetical protein [Dokdonella ginsengisoli]|uniref:PQQ-binding-like beta-propeller repeat protein n=1 Tax=Dokdonella ginsengisoli TaxID=363846 RepID=A0ABV9QVC8_9GAMM
MSHRKILTAVAVLTLSAAGATSAQVPRQLSNPNFRLVDAGTVYASARQPDGGTILIGSFSWINAVPSSGIARIRADGTVDSDWGDLWFQSDPSSYGRPAVAVDAFGAAYVNGLVHTPGGSFAAVVKLSAATGEMVSTWIPKPSTGTVSLAADAEGVYVGRLGDFVKASVDDGTVLWSAPYSAVSLALDDHGAIYAAVVDRNDPSRQFLARFSTSTGALDESWNPEVILVPAWSPPLALDTCGSVYVIGQVAAGGDQTSSRIFKISTSDGSIDPDWGPGPVVGVDAITAGADCSVYLAGRFTTVGDRPRRGLAKLSRLDGRVVDDWLPEGACCAVKELAADSQGRITIAGGIRRIGMQRPLGFARLDATTGEADAVIDAETTPRVTAIAPDPEGGLIVGGDFAKAGSLPRPHLLRLGSNGTLDTEWGPSLEGLAQVHQLSVRPGRSVYVGGGFREANLEPRRSVARFTGATGELDRSWNPDADGIVAAFAFAADGSIYVGGEFSSIGGRARSNIAKLSASTGLADPNWGSSSDGGVFTLAVDAMGSVYAGGAFTEFGGQRHWRLAKIDSGSGNVLHDWTGQAGSSVSMLAVLGSAVYAAPLGWPIQKLSIAGGAADPIWNAPAIEGGARGFVAAADGSLYAVVGGNRLKRFSADAGAEDPHWNISPPGELSGPIAIDTRGTVYAGVYTGSTSSSGLVAYSTDTVFFDPFDS